MGFEGFLSAKLRVRMDCCEFTKYHISMNKRKGQSGSHEAGKVALFQQQSHTVTVCFGRDRDLVVISGRAAASLKTGLRPSVKMTSDRE